MTSFSHLQCNQIVGTPHKPFCKLAGVIVGATVAAAVLGGLAGLLVLRRRRAVTFASPASPGKLKSFLKMSGTGKSPAALGAGRDLAVLDKLFEEAPQASAPDKHMLPFSAAQHPHLHNDHW